MSEWINTGGWIKVHRSLSEHWLAEHPEKLGWWILLLLKATHEEKKVLVGNQLIELKRGQIVASLSFLAELWNTSKRTAERFLELLESDKMLSRCVRQKVSIITICNYDGYQVNKNNMCADTCADDEPIGIQSVSENKKEKELYISSSPSTAPACTYTREEDDFVRRYREEGMWDIVAAILHRPMRECEHLFDRWIMEYQHKGQKHRDYTDFKSHFIQWARITIEKESKSTDNGNQRKYSDRRGTEVSEQANYLKPL